MKKLTEQEKWMRKAIAVAKRGLKEGEVPIGAVVVYGGKVVSRGYNRRAKLQLASAHAEMMAIDKACKKFGSWRLPEGCELYVTLEPCPMCMGAIINSRIKKITFGAKDAKAGACGSVLDMCTYPLNHKPLVESGIMKEECAEVLRRFFAEKR